MDVEDKFEHEDGQDDNHDKSSAELDMIRSLLQAEKSKDPHEKEKITSKFLKSLTPEEAEKVAGELADKENKAIQGGATSKEDRARAYSGEATSNVSHEAGTKVSRLLQRRKRQAIVVAEDVAVSKVVAELVQKRQSAALIRSSSSGAICGIVTDADICRRLVAAKRNPETTLVRDIMTKQPYFVSPSTTILEVFSIMSKHRFRHLPVLDSKAKRVFGVIDITHCLYDAIHRIEKVQQSQVEFVNLVQRSHVRWSSSTEDPGNSRELARQMIDTLMKSVSPDVSTIINRDVQFNLDSSESVLKAAEIMTVNRITAIIGIGSGEYGIFTTKDLLSKVVAKAKDPSTMSIKDCMTISPESCDSTCNLLDALHLMHDGRFLHCPVTAEDNSGEVIGILDVLDCAVWFFNKLNPKDRKPTQQMASGLSSQDEQEKFEFSKLFFSYGNEDDRTITSSTYDGPDSISQYSSNERERNSNALSVKLITSSNTFRLSLDDSLSWEDLQKQILAVAGISCSDKGISLFYKDEDGDHITLNCDEGLSEARALARSQEWTKLDLVVKAEQDNENDGQNIEMLFRENSTILLAGLSCVLLFSSLLFFMSRNEAPNNRYNRRYYRR